MKYTLFRHITIQLYDDSYNAKILIIILSSKIAYFCTDQAPSKTFEGQKCNSCNSHYPGIEIFTWAWAIPVMTGVKTITVAFRLTETITVSVVSSTSTSTAPSLYNVVTRHLQRRRTPMVTMSTGHTYTQQKQGDNLKIFVSLHSQDGLLQLTLRYAFILTVVPIANCIIIMTKCNINCRRENKQLVKYLHWRVKNPYVMREPSKS